jgi:hypothetical protein
MNINYILPYKYPRMMRWGGHVVPMREKRDAYRVLVRKPYGKKE